MMILRGIMTDLAMRNNGKGNKEDKPKEKNEKGLDKMPKVCYNKYTKKER